MLTNKLNKFISCVIYHVCLHRHKSKYFGIYILDRFGQRNSRKIEKSTKNVIEKTRGMKWAASSMAKEDRTGFSKPLFKHLSIKNYCEIILENPHHHSVRSPRRYM